jgi:flagellar protein FliL
MAGNRMDAPKEEGAAAAPAAAPAAAAGGGIGAWIPLLATCILMPVLAFAMTKWVIIPKIQTSLGITAPAASAKEEHGDAKASKPAADAKRESVIMDKLLVNVAGTMGARYLLVTLSIEGSDPDFKEKIETRRAQLKDRASGILRTKTLADLEKPDAVNLIRAELLAGFNNVMGSAIVQEIYVTDFAIQ